MDSATVATSSSCFPTYRNPNPNLQSSFVKWVKCAHTINPKIRTIINPSSASRLSPSSSLLGNPNPNPNRSFVKWVKCAHSTNPKISISPNPNPNPNLSSAPRLSPSSASAVTESPLGTSDLPLCKLERLVSEFQSLSEPIDRVKRLLDYATLLPQFADLDRVTANRVMGCTAQVWLAAAMDKDGRMRFSVDSDSEITKGFCSCLVSILDGALPEEVLELKTEDLGALNVGMPSANSRVNTWHNVLISMKKRTKALVAEREGKQPIEPFPSLVVSENGIEAKGSYAEAQVGVYRMSDERIGCSLADAAASSAYTSFLEIASKSSPALHVIYINTSLDTKAHAHELVPTITCTSSNVVQTMLQAFAQIPDLNIWYGPDSYMGANIAELFRQMVSMTNEEIAAIHPKHDRNSIRSLLPHLHYYQDGACIVHDLFGHEVVKKIHEIYCDAFLTAHLEVPGEMFSLAMEAKRRGMGVVGSTQNILDFIKQRVQEALVRNLNDHLQFVLGTESGMVTSIVAAVREILGSGVSSSGRPKVNVEIVFPVSSDSLSRTSEHSSHGLNSIKASDLDKLTVVPGVTSGEGCSIHGGCASCPYMKMNSLTSLLRICRNLPDKDDILASHEAKRFSTTTPLGKPVADLGCEPILHMRHFQATGTLPEKLVHQILHQSDNERPTVS
ncbi:quinolinate synthase isoform X2 [Tasmannia lanceolata]|uniref:quinolinate synthase isoform X2 n=1 Tax=Tasmannia lanceolata TaxID=3420 RepID=UPI004063EDDC